MDERLVADCGFSYASGFRTTVRLIADHCPTALVAGADLIAFGALGAARAHGLYVPGEFPAVGFDDLPQAAQSFPGLTTVHQSLHAVESQVLPIDDMRLPTKLVVRGTIGPPASAARIGPDRDTDAVASGVTR